MAESFVKEEAMECGSNEKDSSKFRSRSPRVNPERQFREFVGIEGEDEDRDDSDPSMVIPNIRPLLVRTTGESVMKLLGIKS